MVMSPRLPDLTITPTARSTYPPTWLSDAARTIQTTQRVVPGSAILDTQMQLAQQRATVQPQDTGSDNDGNQTLVRSLTLIQQNHGLDWTNRSCKPSKNRVGNGHVHVRDLKLPKFTSSIAVNFMLQINS